MAPKHDHGKEKKPSTSRGSCSRSSCVLTPVVKLDGLIITAVGASIVPRVGWAASGILGAVVMQKGPECWVIVTIAIMESMYKLKYNKEIRLSKEQLIEICRAEQDQTNPTNGEDFGYSVYKAFEMVAANKGLPCTINPKTTLMLRGAKTLDEEQEVIQALAFHPVAARVKWGRSFQHLEKIWYGLTEGDIEYNKKLKESAKKTTTRVSLSHAVLVVGYGTEELYKKNYWIVKNSYGTGWANEGYGKIIRPSSLDDGEWKANPPLFRFTYPDLI